MLGIFIVIMIFTLTYIPYSWYL